MSIYSCHISNVSRAQGSSSCASFSYISAEKVREERTKRLYNYGRSERVIEVQTILPKNAPKEYQDPKKLFNAIENYETASNARTAKKIMVALPREFDLEKQKEVLENYIKSNITSQGYACTYAIHTGKENSNPHAHILIANRKINDKGKWSTKSRKEYVLDEKGERVPLIDKNTGVQKLGKRNEKLWKRVSVQVNPLDKKETLEQLRQGWAVECNKHLSLNQQIEHRSFAKQGKEEEPTIHEGYVARNIEKQGGVSELCEQNRQIALRNNLLKQIQAKLKKIKEKLSALVQYKEKTYVDCYFSLATEALNKQNLKFTYKQISLIDFKKIDLQFLKIGINYVISDSSQVFLKYLSADILDKIDLPGEAKKFFCEFNNQIVKSVSTTKQKGMKL